MTRFTDSPYERMMTQNHLSGREALLPPAPPTDSPCCGLPLWPGCNRAWASATEN